MNQYEELRIAIVKRAIRDYRECEEWCAKHPVDRNQHDYETRLELNRYKKSAVKFFKSNWFEDLCGFNGEFVIEFLEDEYKEQ